MKQLISFIIGLLTFAALVWFVDGWLVGLIVSAFPPAAADWLTIIKIVTWVLVLWATFGIALLIIGLIGGVVWIVLGQRKRR